MDESILPSTSKPTKSTSSHEATNELVDESLILNIKDEEEEIARLQLPESILEGKKTVPVDDERIPKLVFHCENCDMHEMVHYYGKEPPFAYSVKFLEETYVMQDPFQPPPPRWKTKPEYFIALGAKCCKCQRTVCRDSACSIFYTNTFCLDCAAKMGNGFPPEVVTKLTKQLTATKKST